MKKTLKIILGILILALIAVVVVFALNKKDEKNDALRFKEEYESLNGTKDLHGTEVRKLQIDEDNPMVYITAEELIKKMENKETFAVYFGFKECPWCRSLVPTLINVAKDIKLSTIYYVDIKDIRDTLKYQDGKVVTEKEGTESYKKLLEKLDSVLADYSMTDSDGNEIETNEKRIYAPNVVSIVNGKAEKLTEGTSKLQTDAYMELTEEMNNEMYENVKCVLKCVKDNQAVCESAC